MKQIYLGSLVLLSACHLLLSSLGESGNCDDLIDNDNNGLTDCQDVVCSLEPLCLSDCGDGVLQSIEECDDSNNLSNDGCSDVCVIELCGDSIIQSGLGETCDDGNATSGDGCSDACVDELLCGNGNIDIGEECDDGNAVDTDGCLSNCQNASVCDASAFPFGQRFATNPIDGSCWVLSSVSRNFSTARSDCLSFLGDVASIADAAEQSIADQLTQGTEAWIGLSDSAQEGTFIWLDGTPFAFVDFAPNEPNNSFADDVINGEDCVVTKNVAGEGWIDITCNFNRLFLCTFP